MEIKKLGLIFIVGAILYIFIEVVSTALTGNMTHFTGNTYWSLQGFSSVWMMLLGGFLLVILGKLNEVKWFHVLPMFFQALIGCFIITLFEFLSGCLLNLHLGFNLWDYSKLPLNLMGQINLIFSIFWFLISPLAFWLDDLLRWVFYKTGWFIHNTGLQVDRVSNLKDYYKELFKIFVRNDI